MDLEHWRVILHELKARFPRLRRVSAYAMATNVLAKSAEELEELRRLGLELLYVGPESGDDVTLKRIVKGANFDDHAEAAAAAKRAGMKLSVIFLLGAGGRERSAEHASASARLATAMDPEFLSALTLTVIAGTPIATLESRGKYQVPEVSELLGELRTLVLEANPTDAIFRTNHASNYLPIEGRLPRDREAIVAVLTRAIAGEVGLRPEWARGL